MSELPIKLGPIFRGANRHETPEGFSYNLTNVVRMMNGGLKKRRGYTLLKDFSAARPIVRLAAIEHDNTGVMVIRNSSGTNLIVDWLDADGSTVNNIINATSANLLNDEPISVAEVMNAGSQHVVIGGGAGKDMILLKGALNSAPTVVTLTNGPAGGVLGHHAIAFARGYLMAAMINPIGETQFNNNSPTGGDFNVAGDWRLYSNVRKPDSVVSLFNVRDEILNLGPRSMEWAWLDGASPWAEIDGSYTPYGTFSTLGAAQIGDDVFFPSLIRGFPNFVRVGEDHVPEIIGDSIVGGRALTSDDPLIKLQEGLVLGQTMNLDGIPYYVAQDPTNSTYTLVYDILHKEWFRFSKYSAGVHSAWPLKYLAMPNWFNSNDGSPTVLGSDLTANSKVFRLNGADLTDAGDTIRCEIELGNISFGTQKKKRMNNLYFRIRRVSGASFTVAFRDENGTYSTARTVSMDPISGEIITVFLPACGEFRNRMIKIVHESSTHAFELHSISADVEVMTS